MGGTPEFLMDTRRGLYSYQALQSRLAENTFAVKGLTDYSGPVLRLDNLTQEDFYILTGKLRHVFAFGDISAYLLPDEGLKAFMEHCSKRIGDAYFRTPRTTITSFINLLAVLEQNRDAKWQDLLGTVEIRPDTMPDLSFFEEESENPETTADLTKIDNRDDDLAKFKL